MAVTFLVVVVVLALLSWCELAEWSRRVCSLRHDFKMFWRTTSRRSRQVVVGVAVLAVACLAGLGGFQSAGYNEVADWGQYWGAIEAGVSDEGAREYASLPSVIVMTPEQFIRLHPELEMSTEEEESMHPALRRELHSEPPLGGIYAVRAHRP